MLKIGLVSISDRASQGVYEDKGLPRCGNGWRARSPRRSKPSAG
ncbi:Molybdopterin adenylyltransferase [Chromobacterium violaceum]|uniref:Molybdopterin adenylyltransferase n=1 Tax=Chromobacterium violaceum TaxID=536 RepID=A0A3S4HPD8_CHRVL|nr:Molybdopterin adenylyltransferase [Chromobacterium violaceum]